MRTHTSKPRRHRGCLWTAAVVGFLIAAAATAVLNTPWKPTMSGGGLFYQVAWIDSKGALREGPRSQETATKSIGVSVHLALAFRGENLVWQRITISLTPNTQPVPGQLVPDAASIARGMDFRQNIAVPIAPHDIPWERVMAGQSYSWIEPGWPEVRRIAAISAAVGLPAGAALYGLAALVQSRLRRPGRCARCGYDLAGLSENTKCPECGVSSPRP